MQNLTIKRAMQRVGLWPLRCGLGSLALAAGLALAGCLPLQVGVEPRATPGLGLTRVAPAATTAAPATSTDGLRTPTPARTLVAGVTATPSVTASATAPQLSDTAAAAATETATAPHTPTTRPVTGCALTHTVQPGERLFAIATLYGVRWQDIASLNGLADPALIFAGQVLCLPDNARLPSTPTRTPSPTASATATATPSLTPSPTLDACLSPPAWFFSPAPGGCATAPALTSQAAAQRFESGQMIWLAARDEYFVLYDGATQSNPGAMTYLPGPLSLRPGASADNRVSDTPPPGREQPVSGFGLIWRDEVEGAQNMRAQLGWATQSEFAFSTPYQCLAAPAPEWHCYLRAPDGRVLRLSFIPQQGYFWQPQ